MEEAITTTLVGQPTSSVAAVTDGTPQVSEPQTTENTESKETLVSPRLQAMAARERYLLSERRKLKEREYRLHEKSRAVQQFEGLKQNAKMNPLKVLESLGLSYQDITNYVLNGEKPTADAQIDQVQKQLQNLQKDQEARDHYQEQLKVEEARREYDEVVNDYQEQIQDFVTEKADEYELINLYGGQDLIMETIKQHFINTKKEGRPKILSTKEAADLVEGYLEEELTKANKTKKYKRLFGLQQEQTESPLSRSSSKTLSNELVSQSASLLPTHVESDRMRRAMAKLG